MVRNIHPYYHTHRWLGAPDCYLRRPSLHVDRRNGLRVRRANKTKGSEGASRATRRRSVVAVRDSLAPSSRFVRAVAGTRKPELVGHTAADAHRRAIDISARRGREKGDHAGDLIRDRATSDRHPREC
jgi:hypothetical protein